MKEIINEYIFYTINCIIVTIVSIYLSFTYHNGSIIHLLFYAFSISTVFTLMGKIINLINNKRQKDVIEHEIES
ncbi:MAG: hypothetical protein K0Q49_857 [Haloplasmataceae bacterium]|jgi:hypothetical protein|nr:hypothetical protein [Haloplasmataceae bacterium]